MPAFPRNLKEIKDRREKERRPKPLATNDLLTPDLGPKFKQANEEEVKHAHHGDEKLGDHGPKSLAQKEFLEKNEGIRKDMIAGMHALDEIEKWIVGETSRLLDKINQALADFNEANDSTQSAAAETKYNAATKEFNDFVNKLNNPAKDPTGNFGATINSATIEPIQTGGYYVSARVIIEWRGGTHSGSSLIHVP